MGYVINGKLAFRSGDQEEVFEAGDAYFVGLGHTPVLYAGTEVVESSPTEELAKTMEVVTQNMEAEPAPRTALLKNYGGPGTRRTLQNALGQPVLGAVIARNARRHTQTGSHVHT